MAFTATIIGMRLGAETPTASISFAVKINPPSGSEHIDNFDAVGVRVLAHSDLTTINAFPFTNTPAPSGIPSPQEIFRWQAPALVGGQEYRLNTTTFAVPAGTVALSAAPIFRDVDEGASGGWKYYDDMLVRSHLGTVQEPPPVIGFVPNSREGQYTIKDFTVLDGIHRINGFYEKLDIDFINTQLLSMKQGANKMRRIAASTDPNFTIQFRPRTAREEVYSARRSQTFNEYLLECARVLDFAINEVQNNQKFNLDNVQFQRTIIR